MSNELKATKGPWVFRDKTGEIGIIDNSDTQSYGMMLVIANMDTYDHHEHEANAHLIAASPELYEALDELLNSVIHSDCGPSPSVIDYAIAALEKARGENS